MGLLRIAVLLTVVGCATRRDRTPGDGSGPECTDEGMHRCSGSTYQVCTNGSLVTDTECLTACLDGLGCVECGPGTTFCKDGNVFQCDDTGHPGMQVQICGGQTTCIDGGCADACLDAENSKSYIGCEYYAVDLDNAVEVWGALSQSSCTTMFSGVSQTMEVCFRTQGPFVFTAGTCNPPATMGGAKTCPSGYACGTQSNICVSDAQHSPFAIVVSNPQAKPVNITVTGPGGQTIMRTVAAGQVDAILPQAGGAIPDQSVDGSLKAKRAYKIASDLPIVAYQFNPLDNVDVFSNDASLLIPRTVFDTDYFAMTKPTLDRRTPAPGTNPYYGYLAVVAWQDNTQITVTPTAAITAGPSNGPIAAGDATTFTLAAFEVLQLQAAGSGDLTGSHIVSTNGKSFGAFGGHEATAFGETTPPDGGHTAGPCCADHLEEMLFPSTTWGKEFAIARSKQRTNEGDILRVLAQKAGTTVAFTPAPAAGTCGTLGPGQFCEVKIAGDTEIVASEPILVGHFLQSSIWSDTQGANTGPIGNGDPSMAIGVPTEQYRKDYTVLVPAQYDESYLSISAAPTGGVAVDGAQVTVTTFAGGGTHRVARIPVTAGQHRITCADGCGVLVYGYSNSVSYMFAGGLDLKPIVVLLSDDDERPYDDDTPLPVKPRPKAKNLPLRPSVPSVERSLDRFIEEAKATPHAHDVSYFDAGTREDQLANEITELRKQLAATEQRAADAAATVRAPTPIEPAPARMRWGAVVAAFAIGGACMFAVTRLTRESSGGASAAAPVPSAPVHAAVDPEQKPEPVKQAAPEPAPAIPTAPDQPAPAVALKPKPAIKNPIKRTVKPVDPPPPSPPAKPSSDDGLYNPFGPAK